MALSRWSSWILKYLHDEGYVFGDPRPPGVIMIAENGAVRVIGTRLENEYFTKVT